MIVLTLCVLVTLAFVTACIVISVRMMVGYMKATTTEAIEAAGQVNILVMQETAAALQQAYLGPQGVDEGERDPIETEAMDLTKQPDWMRWGDVNEDDHIDPLDGIIGDPIDLNAGRVAGVPTGGLPSFPAPDAAGERYPE